LCKEIQAYNKRFLFRAESLNEEMIIDSIQNLKKYFPMEKNQSSRSVRGNFDIDLELEGAKDFVSIAFLCRVIHILGTVQISFHKKRIRS
jgi:hypothetical protein